MLSYLVCSDIHLGHTNTPTSHIINSFKSKILTPQNKDIDVLYIAGDLFDHLLDLNSREVQLIISFFNQLLSYCTENDILLRVLEGTPSHDRHQSQILVKLNDIRTHKCDLKYFDKLDIEYIAKLNQYVLYIPDEWTNDHTTLEKEIQEKLNQHTISQVDIAILHGQFQYQFIGKKYTGFYFKEEYFLSLVKGFIHIGHYHTYSTFDRVIANGSLERLTHGEESPKGYVRVNGNIPVFIENENAFTYKTINITSAMNIDRLDLQIQKYPKGSHLRLLMNREHPFNVTYTDIKLRYLDYHLKKQLKETASEDATIAYIITDEALEYTDKFTLDGNLQDLLLSIINSKYSLNALETQRLNHYTNILREDTTDERQTT
jgi:DNA repair exonuclease SbcCD nuclease subunit